MTKRKAHQKKVRSSSLLGRVATRLTCHLRNLRSCGNPLTRERGTLVPALFVQQPQQYPNVYGYDAGARGCPLSDNPYDFGIAEHRLWTDGWHAARSDMMPYSAFQHRNYERRLAVPKRPVVDPDVQELLDDNVHALRFSLYDNDGRITVVNDDDDGWREDEEII